MSPLSHVEILNKEGSVCAFLFRYVRALLLLPIHLNIHLDPYCLTIHLTVVSPSILPLSHRCLTAVIVVSPPSSLSHRRHHCLNASSLSHCCRCHLTAIIVISLLSNHHHRCLTIVSPPSHCRLTIIILLLPSHTAASSLPLCPTAIVTLGISVLP